jgi:hypothetical protein
MFLPLPIAPSGDVGEYAVPRVSRRKVTPLIRGDREVW